MQKTSIFTVIVFATSLVLTLPAHADSFVTFATPTTAYTTSTVDYGGGDGSWTMSTPSTLTSLGPFAFSTSMEERAVPATWTQWNTPPAVESSTPNVLFGAGFTSVTLTLALSPTIAGFELEPDNNATPSTFDSISVAFFNEDSMLIDTINANVFGQGGALLFALEDTTPGATIGSIVITDNSDDDFSIAQLRANTTTPEPGTLSLLGLGMLGLAVLAYRKTVNA